jgi:hypothetical protein
VGAGAPVASTPADQLLQALAPLASQARSIGFECCRLQLGSTEAYTLGRSALRSLTLRLSYLAPGFWPALAQALPQLPEVSVGPAVKTCGVELGVFCGMRASAPPAVPLTLKISMDSYGRPLRAGLSALRSPHSSVQVLNIDHPDEESDQEDEG